MHYVGSIIRESFQDPTLLDSLPIVSEREAAPAGVQQHMVTVVIPEEQIDFAISAIQRSLDLTQPVSARLSNGVEDVVIYPQNVFRFPKKDRESRQWAVSFGEALGISRLQLEFLTQ